MVVLVEGALRPDAWTGVEVENGRDENCVPQRQEQTLQTSCLVGSRRSERWRVRGSMVLFVSSGIRYEAEPAPDPEVQ
jgi:hypothetical protein